MDSRKIGKLIASKRKEKSMTQKELGLKINVSDKTISKWESGLGLPDLNCKYLILATEKCLKNI